MATASLQIRIFIKTKLLICFDDPVQVELQAELHNLAKLLRAKIGKN
jgi:hypothetical protein